MLLSCLFTVLCPDTHTLIHEFPLSFYSQYFKNSLNTRLSIVYIETWQGQNKVGGLARQRNINQVFERAKYDLRIPLNILFTGTF